MASFPVTLDGSCFMLCLLKINFENDNITDTIENEIVKLLIKYKKYIKIVYEEMELIPNKKAPGTINIKKDDVEDVVFQINLK